MPTINNPVTCPYCGYVADASRNMTGEEHEPNDADVALCFGCGVPAMYVKGEDGLLTLRQPTEEEVEEISQNHTLVNLSAKIMIKRAAEQRAAEGNNQADEGDSAEVSQEFKDDDSKMFTLSVDKHGQVSVEARISKVDLVHSLRSLAEEFEKDDDYLAL